MIDAMKVQSTKSKEYQYWLIYLDENRRKPAALIHHENMKKFLLALLSEDPEIKDFVKHYIDKL